MSELVKKDEVIEQICIADYICDRNYQNGETLIFMDDLVERIKSLEIIEGRPKGEWLRKEYYFDEWVDECSVCGEAYTMIDGTATDNGYNYCPNCGAYMVADMRGEE